MAKKTAKKPPKRKPGPKEEVLIITEDPDVALTRLLATRKPTKKA